MRIYRAEFVQAAGLVVILIASCANVAVMIYRALSQDVPELLAGPLVFGALTVILMVFCVRGIASSVAIGENTLVCRVFPRRKEICWRDVQVVSIRRQGDVVVRSAERSVVLDRLGPFLGRRKFEQMVVDILSAAMNANAGVRIEGFVESRFSRCRRCTYSLSGLHEARCPECGMCFDSRILQLLKQEHEPRSEERSAGRERPRKDPP